MIRGFGALPLPWNQSGAGRFGRLDLSLPCLANERAAELRALLAGIPGGPESPTPESLQRRSQSHNTRGSRWVREANGEDRAEISTALPEGPEGGLLLRWLTPAVSLTQGQLGGFWVAPEDGRHGLRLLAWGPHGWVLLPRTPDHHDVVFQADYPATDEDFLLRAGLPPPEEPRGRGRRIEDVTRALIGLPSSVRILHRADEAPIGPPRIRLARWLRHAVAEEWGWTTAPAQLWLEA